MKTLFFAALLALSAAEARTTPAAGPSAMAEAPAAPSFEGWRKTGEVVATREQIAPIEAKLGGKIAALRDAAYLAGAKKIRINVIVPLNSGEGDRIFAALSKTKPAWSLVRKDGVIYELVAGDDAIAEAQKAHDQLAR